MSIMCPRPVESPYLRDITVDPDVMDYIAKRGGDYRICTSCGGPVLLSVRIKPPKKSDLLIRAGKSMIYVSIHQARYLHSISADMIPFYDDPEFSGFDPA